MAAQDFTVYDILARGAAVHGAAPAVFQGETEVSFGELRRRVDALAGGLAAQGLGKGDRICVLAQNDLAYLDLYGACARQGIIAYPINWRLTGEEVERVLERAAPKMMVVDAATLGVVGAWPGAKPAIPHWYQLGQTPAAGFKAFAALYREGPAPEPAVVGDDVLGDAEKRKAFSDASRVLLNRIRIFTSLPLAKLDKLSLQKKLDDLGRLNA